MTELRLTTAGAYVEDAPDAQLWLTTAGAYVEWGIPQTLRVTTLGAYVEYEVPWPPPHQVDQPEPMSCGQVRISTDCTNWVDVSGSVNDVAVGELARQTAMVWKFVSLYPVVRSAVTAGPVPVTVRAVYTEASSEAYEIALGVMDGLGCGSVLCVDWTPNGGNVGDERYQVQGVLKRIELPRIAAGEAGPVLAEFMVVGYVSHGAVTA